MTTRYFEIRKTGWDEKIEAIFNAAQKTVIDDNRPVDMEEIEIELKAFPIINEDETGWFDTVIDIMNYLQDIADEHTAGNFNLNLAFQVIADYGSERHRPPVTYLIVNSEWQHTGVDDEY